MYLHIESFICVSGVVAQGEAFAGMYGVLDSISRKKKKTLIGNTLSMPVTWIKFFKQKNYHMRVEKCECLGESQQW